MKTTKDVLAKLNQEESKSEPDKGVSHKGRSNSKLEKQLKNRESTESDKYIESEMDYKVLINLAVSYISNIDKTETAIKLLERALELIATITDEAEKVKLRETKLGDNALLLLGYMHERWSKHYYRQLLDNVDKQNFVEYCQTSAVLQRILSVDKMNDYPTGFIQILTSRGITLPKNLQTISEDKIKEQEESREVEAWENNLNNQRLSHFKQ